VGIFPNERALSVFLRRIGWGAALGLFLLFHLAPFLWQVLTSLKEAGETFRSPVTYWPEHVTFDNYRRVFLVRPFGRYLVNSVIVATLATGSTVILAACAAYAIARLHVRGGRGWLRASLLITAVPAIVFLVPLYQVVRGLGLMNSLGGLVLVYTGLNLPLALWLLTAAFRAVPVELEEAAQVDGMSRWQILWKILVPLTAPAMVTAALLVFLGCWNEFLFALTFLSDESLRTVPVGVAMLSGVTTYELPWGLITAAIVITTFPLMVLAVVAQRRLVEGLTAGAIK